MEHWGLQLYRTAQQKPLPLLHRRRTTQGYKDNTHPHKRHVTPRVTFTLAHTTPLRLVHVLALAFCATHNPTGLWGVISPESNAR